MRRLGDPAGSAGEDNRLHGRPRAGSRGGSKLKALLWLLLLLAAGYVGYKLIPIYFANYQLLDKMQTEARFATVNRHSDEEIKNIVFREIQDREIPARRDDIRVLENSQRGVRISVDYTVTVDLNVYQLKLRFNPIADNRGL